MEVAKSTEKWGIYNAHILETAIMINIIKMYSEVLNKTFRVLKKLTLMNQQSDEIYWSLFYTIFLLLSDSSYLFLYV